MTTHNATDKDKILPPGTHTETFLPYMRDVARCEQSLQELNQMWRIIEASAKMNCPTEAKSILPTMAATRSGFSRLERELVSSLAHEKVRNVLAEIGTKARYVIDIVVRNLFERTADVGFLATDRELCNFVAGLTDSVEATRYRLREYRNKYTVYDEIILLDTEGNVLVQIDPTTPLEHSADPLIRQTLESDTYVETFRATDLRPAKERALVYSRRMHHPQTGAVIGVLCLCFHFEEEMAGIFAAHGDPQGRSNMLLLDGENRVIASADALWIPPGSEVPVNIDGQPRLMMHSGRQYLVRTFASEGYQGNPGPTGWQGQVMIPVDVAFNDSASDTLSQLAPEVAEGLLAPFLQQHRRRARNVGGLDRAQPRHRLTVVQHQRDLQIQLERAHVHIARPDRRDVVVDADVFGVQHHRRVEQPDLDTHFKQLLVVGLLRLADHKLIVDARHNQRHIHPALGGG